MLDLIAERRDGPRGGPHPRQAARDQVRAEYARGFVTANLRAGGPDAIPFTYDDGGREAAGFPAEPRGCAVGAIAIVTGRPYAEVHSALSVCGDPDLGVPAWVIEDYLAGLGFTVSEPERSVSRAYTTASDLPRAGRFVLQFVLCQGAWITTPMGLLGRDPGSAVAHLSALVDGELHDDTDTRRLPVCKWWSR